MKLNIFKDRLTRAAGRTNLAFLALFLTVSNAGAQDWAAPATGLVESIASGLDTFLQPLVVIAVVIYGVVCAFARRFIMQEILIIVGGAALVFFGADMLQALLAG